MKAPRNAVRRHLSGSPLNASAALRPAETFAVCGQVTHDKYGLGVIPGVEDGALLVDFRPDQRRIALPCAKLTKLYDLSAGCPRTKAGLEDAARSVAPEAIMRRSGTSRCHFRTRS